MRHVTDTAQPKTAPIDLGGAARRLVQLAALLGFALTLGACSKCDVPDFTHWGAPSGPHACHDDPPPR